MSIQDFTNERSSARVRRPKELVVTVDLPGVESAKSVELDIFEKQLLLQCKKPLYKLDVSFDFDFVSGVVLNFTYKAILVVVCEFCNFEAG